MTTSGVRHTKISAVIDDADASLVRPSEWNDDHTITYVAPSGLTGATAASRYVGATASGSPGSGTFAVGDFVIDQTAKVWVCTVAGSPGTWKAAGGGPAYPALKPSTPTDDFNAALSGWSAHSNLGSFAIGHAMAQGEDWGGSALELQFSAQCGTIFKSQANTDFDFTFGGIKRKGLGDANVMIGIAAVNSSGNGVGVLSYIDSNAYFATIGSYNYTTNSGSWAGHGTNNADGDFWMRLKRISGTWTGYVSQSGRAWDFTFGTRSDSITVTEIHFGILYNSGSSYSGRLIADYYQKDI